MDFTNAFNNGNRNGKPPSGIDIFDSAEEYKPLPGGIYLARVQRGEFSSTRAGDDAYRMTFQITEGIHTGKTISRIWTLTAKAAGYAKKELPAFGITSGAKMLEPFPPVGKEYHVRLTVAVQRGNDGREFNDIKRIEILRIDDSPAAGFELPDDPDEGQS